MSLLTQFYPGPGGGGGGSDVSLTTSGYGSIIYPRGGIIPTYTQADWIGSPLRGALIPNPSATSQSANIINSAIQWNNALYAKEMFVNNIYFGASSFNIVLETTLERLVLNNCVWGGTTGATPSFSVSSCSAIKSIEGTAVITGNFNIQSCPNLTTVSPDIVWVLANTSFGQSFNFVFNNLDAASVNGILISMSKNAAGGAGVGLNFNGGGNAGSGALTLAGSAAVSDLNSRGYTVNLNP